MVTPAPVLVPLQFCSAIVLIFFLELAVAVLAFLFQDWVRDRFREFFESNIRSYRDDIDLQNLIDSLQKAVSTTFSLIEPGFPGFSLCAWLGGQAGGEHWAFPPSALPTARRPGEVLPPDSGQVSFVCLWLLAGQACSQGALPHLLWAGSPAAPTATLPSPPARTGSLQPWPRRRLQSPRCCVC